jgi:hypothetical protein
MKHTTSNNKAFGNMNNPLQTQVHFPALVLLWGKSNSEHRTAFQVHRVLRHATAQVMESDAREYELREMVQCGKAVHSSLTVQCLTVPNPLTEQCIAVLNPLKEQCKTVLILSQSNA